MFMQARSYTVRNTIHGPALLVLTLKVVRSATSLQSYLHLGEKYPFKKPPFERDLLFICPILSDYSPGLY